MLDKIKRITDAFDENIVKAESLNDLDGLRVKFLEKTAKLRNL